jgi:dolichyl-phosphate-mannose-protein mannosyltransferase
MSSRFPIGVAQRINLPDMMEQTNYAGRNVNQPPEAPEREADLAPITRSRWERADSVALFIILVVATVLRFASLGDPSEMIFDEVYYAKDSCFYVLNDPEVCQVDGTQAEVHPPVGKWLIGMGIKAFGFDSFGWRIAPAIGGVLTVLVMYLLARRLFGSWLWATIAAGLLAFDPLHFVQSRTSMLDIFLPMFGLAAILFLLFDRDRSPVAPHGSDPPKGVFARPWFIASGAAAGLAVATKWTGGFYLALLILLTVAWSASKRQGSRPKAWWAAVRSEAPSIALWLIALPLLIYVVSYAGQIGGKLIALPWSEGSWGRAFFDHHKYMWDFHTNLEATHGYQSAPHTWMLIKRPVSYFFCAGASCKPAIADGDYQEIFAVGSPLVWWTSIIAMLGVAATWIRRRNASNPAGLILAGFAFTYGPWLLPGASRSAVFLFYLLPAVPFMILALVFWMHRIGETWEGRAATALFSAGALAMFAFYYPLLTKRSLPQPDWQKRIWIFDNCDKPPGPVVTSTVTTTASDGTVETSLTETEDNSSLPPTGWCWI